MSAEAPLEQVELSHHPGPRQYVGVAVVLAIITGIEVAIYYVSSLKSVLVPMLIVLSILKFSLVVLWFMHLRFDSLMFRRLFVTGVVLAFAVFAVVLVIFFTALGGPAPVGSS
ncbi:MAG: cytochrome C oxidase subunit IV family protein [Actinomycetota bacterium]|nr:cytochrome C oxidase subunit IV family protein [Actinomycetota bacterium]